MHEHFIRNRKLILLLFFTIALKLFSLSSVWVESLYTLGFYPVISKLLRAIFGWMPFSFGDIIYGCAGIWVLLKIIKLIRLLYRREVAKYLSWSLLRKYIKVTLVVYLVFNLFWGLNYSRLGITHQLGLSVQPYSSAELFSLTTILRQRLVSAAEKVDSLQRLQYNENKVLFAGGVAAYDEAKNQFPFLAYAVTSIKPSLFTPVGHWFGFTGYYNPFSGEAQLKTSVPVFLKPFIVTHEMAHQLGYAKENEANFVAYLTCKGTADGSFVYSAYYEMYRDAIFECRQRFGKPTTDSLVKDLPLRVKWDSYELRRYLLSEENFIEPFMSGAYDKYLKLNNQPKGKATYNEVIAYLVAYLKKFGAAAI